MNFSEIIIFALDSIRTNKLRSFLTLLGIVVGVFSIIAVMTAVRVLENSIESGLSQLGTHTFQIQKTPQMASQAEWIKAQKRKNIEYDQALRLKERMTQALYVAVEGWSGGKVVQFGSLKTNPNVSVGGEEPEGIQTNNWNIEEGRNFLESDLRSASPVVILGADVAKKIFPRGGAIGQDVRVGQNKYTVIGVFEPKGSVLGGNMDNFVAIPMTRFLNDYGKNRSLNIMIKAKSDAVYNECLEEARNILRTIRKVPPGEPDDFAIFSNESLIETFNEFTRYVKLGVSVISFIALITAGIGIMNIMLVSVTERTKEIGIRKSLGARRSDILRQFILESIVLCEIGGLIGIILGIIGGNITALAFKVPVIFPVDWAIIGVIITTCVGLVFGVYPAWKAANLDPIEALRYE
ncbi:MAG TPA: ABC transporter permease [Bacteroidota bacterium]|nr:ABC transporter permease [Bacteroidota bacterium]